VIVGIRSEDVRVGPNEAAAARVHDVENHGVEKIVTLRVDGHLFKATIPANVDVSVESDVRFGWNPEKLHCFDKTTGLNVAIPG
jgi:multiple sugar transport system ATP-binding protein